MPRKRGGIRPMAKRNLQRSSNGAPPIGLGCAGDESRDRRDKANAATSHKPEDIPVISPQIQESEHAESPPRKNDRSIFRGRLNITEWLTFIVGVGSLVVSYLTYRNAADTSDLQIAVRNLARLADQARRQADAQQAQLDEAKLEQRPFVYADILPNGQMYWSESHILAIPVAFLFHNTGHRPALSVSSVATLTLGVYPNEFKPIQETVCSQRKKDVTTGRLGGETVFPGQIGTALLAAGGDINKQMWDASGRAGLGAPIALVGCTVYLVPDDPVPHSTGFSFLVGRKVPGTNDFIILPSDPTSVSKCPSTNILSHLNPL